MKNGASSSTASSSTDTMISVTSPMTSSCDMNTTRMRKSVVTKMMAEQESYISILSFHQNKIRPTLEECGEKVEYNIDEHQIRDLYGNWENLLKIEEIIRKKITCDTTSTSNQTFENIGSTLYNLREGLKAYEEYFNIFGRIMKIAEYIRQTTVNNQLQKLQPEVELNEARLNRDGFLKTIIFQPLHHVCQMSVLLKMLAVFTSPTHADLRDVIKSYQIYQNLVMKIESFYQKSFLEEAYFICDQLQSEWDQLGISDKNGFATKRGGNVKSWKIRWFTIRHYEMKYFEEPLADKPLTTLDLRQCQRAFADNSQDKTNCIGLEFRDRTYFMYFTSINERSDWLNLLAWKIYLLKNANYRASQSISSIKSGAFPNALSLIV